MSLIMYEKKDISVAVSCLNSLTVTGIEAARRIATIATILESGKPMEEKTEEKKGDETSGNL